MSVTVDELIKLLDTEGNRYGGATGKPRELNISINGNFCGSIESAKLDGFGDGLVTDVTLEIEAPKMREYYDKETRDKAIEEFAEKLKEKAEGMVEGDCGGINEMSYERAYNRGLFDMEDAIDEIAEDMKEVGE